MTTPLIAIIWHDSDGWWLRYRQPGSQQVVFGPDTYAKIKARVPAGFDERVSLPDRLDKRKFYRAWARVMRCTP